jgi:hypothetical protein
MASTSRIVLTRLDGTQIAFETRTFMCLADRVAFERHFHSSSAALSALRDKFDAEGVPIPGADLSDLQEEHVAFLVWCAARRTSHDVGSFEDFVMALEDFEMTDEPVEAGLDPTAPPSERSQPSLSSSG